VCETQASAFICIAVSVLLWFALLERLQVQFKEDRSYVIEDVLYEILIGLRRSNS
jgi:hypothetical protein